MGHLPTFGTVREPLLLNGPLGDTGFDASYSSFLSRKGAPCTALRPTDATRRGTARVTDGTWPLLVVGTGRATRSMSRDEE